MKRLLLCLLLLSFYFRGLAQFEEEATLSDLKSCPRFYWYGTDIAKKISNAHDTFSYFHDGELIIFFNKKKTKRLRENSFYIFNHGFNKLITINIAMIEFSVANGKKDKKIFISTPESNCRVLYEDSLARCEATCIGPLYITTYGYEKSEISSLLLEIKYYDQYIVKYFLKEPDITATPTSIMWRIVRGE